MKRVITSLLLLTLWLAACTTSTPPTGPAPTGTASLPAAATTLIPTLTSSQTPQPTATAKRAFTPRPTYTRTSLPTATNTRTPWPTGALSLRDLAAQRNFYIGAAVQSGLIADEEIYRQTLAKEFNILTPEWEMKMCAVWPERDRFDFAASDALVQFAQDHQMRVRGHTLVWTECLPNWISTGKFSPQEAQDLLHEYISTLVGRYKGKIAYWDVLNETLQRKPVWEDLIGPDYTKLAFQWAHEADPQALLFYNDYDAEMMNPKSDQVYEMVKGWLAEGVPIHGVGFQMHIKGFLNPASVASNIDRLNALGLEVHITEVDIPRMEGALDPDERQAEEYAKMLDVCLQAKNCPVFIIWGFTDKYTWYTENMKQPNAAPLIFDADYRPKPAYAALYSLLGGQ